jgi:hypothetical protein
MNIYEQQGVAVDMAAGHTVLVCADSVYSRHIATTMLEALDDISNDAHQAIQPAPELEVTRAIKSYGRERIQVASGGRLVFARSIDAMRGYSAKRVLISQRVRESAAYLDHMGWMQMARLVTANVEGSSIEQLSG